MDLDSPTPALTPTPPPPPRTKTFPSNGSWTIYGRSGPYFYAQPHFISHPLFVPIHIQGDILIAIGIQGIPDGFIKNPLLAHSKFYKRVLKMLTSISSDPTFDFTTEYRALPFNACRILITRSGGGISALTEWSDNWESTTLSYTTLSNLWSLPLPPALPLSSLTLHTYLHDTVALVSIPTSPALYTLKTNRRPSALYDELHTLLTLPPHPNILQRPTHLIHKPTANSLFHPLDPSSPYITLPTLPIVAFLTPYYPGGTLKSHLRLNPLPPLPTLAKWAVQLTAALTHVFTNGGMYTALKTDNIVLDANGDLRLIDFEKAGTWIQYTPPEVLRFKAPRDPGPKWVLGSAGAGCSVCEPHSCAVPRGSGRGVCYEVHAGILEWRYSKANILDPGRRNSRRTVAELGGFWGVAGRSEVEGAMVWMLGCCLWCIFEGVGCLGDLGKEWFPVWSPLWRRARARAGAGGRVEGGVLAFVERCVGRGVRPGLEEVGEVMRGWERRVELGGEGVEWGVDSGDERKRELSRGPDGVEAKRRRVEGSNRVTLEWVGRAASVEMVDLPGEGG